MAAISSYHYGQDPLAEVRDIMDEMDAEAREREEEADDRRRRAARQVKEAKEAEKQRANLAAQQHDWDARFDARFAAKYKETLIGENSVLTEAIGELLADDHKTMLAHVVKAKEGLRAEFAAQFAELKGRMETAVGKVPIAKTWAPESITYQGAFVSHGGSTWQARVDTAKRPGGNDDWVLISRVGRDGASVTPRGEFDPRDCYTRLDLVTKNGSSFIAVSDNPGDPGDDGGGWQPLALRGAAFDAEQMRQRQAELTQETERLFGRVEQLIAESEQRMLSADLSNGALNDALSQARQQIEQVRTEVAEAEVRVLKRKEQMISDVEERERQARRDELAATISELRRDVDAMGELIASERRAERDQFKRALEDQKCVFAERLAAQAEGLKATAGKLPPAKVWGEGCVVYENEIASFDGALYQARCDTGARPGDPAAWVCVARAGRDGASVTPRGEWAEHDAYSQLDIVVYKDSSYIAVRNDPGRPSDEGAGWMMLAGRGLPGAQGKAGPPGQRGEAETPTSIRSWEVDTERCRASPLMSNGQVGAMLELAPIFELARNWVQSVLGQMQDEIEDEIEELKRKMRR